MSHEINRMIYVGEVPWHGLGVRLPARATYQEIVEHCGFYEAVERPYSFSHRTPRSLTRRRLSEATPGRTSA